MEKFETTTNFVPINSFYLLSDEEALKSDLAKLIFVWGKFQECHKGEDKIMHYIWSAVYVEVEVINGWPYSKSHNTRTMDIEVLNKFYSELKSNYGTQF